MNNFKTQRLKACTSQYDTRPFSLKMVTVSAMTCLEEVKRGEKLV